MIEELAVETGFLRNQRLEFASTFNVILGDIGAKELAAELIRFAIHGESPLWPAPGIERISLTVRAPDGRKFVAVRANGETVLTEGGERIPGSLGDHPDVRVEYYDYDSIREIGLNSQRQLLLLDRRDEKGNDRQIERKILGVQKQLERNAREILALIENETGAPGATAAGVPLSGLSRVRLDAERAALVHELEDLRVERYECRTATANEINRHLGERRQISVRRLADREPYRLLLESALGSLRDKASSLAVAISARLSPLHLFVAVQAGRASEIEDRAGLSEYDSRRVTDLLRDSPSIFEIQTVDLLDGSDITFLKPNAQEWQSAAHCSQGERTVAVLPILLHGTCPIVISNPHRGLCGGDIYEEILPFVRAARKVRQVIFATEHPVLVVNGHADRIIVLDQRKGDCVQRSGTLEERVEDVIQWCEGGREAFRRRLELHRGGAA